MIRCAKCAFTVVLHHGLLCLYCCSCLTVLRRRRVPPGTLRTLPHLTNDTAGV